MLQRLQIYLWINLNKFDQIWKTTKRFYEWTESKTLLSKVGLKFDCKWIEFRDTSVCRHEQSKLQAVLFWKSSDHQNFLKDKLENPYSLKKSISYSQALLIRQICSVFQDYHSHSRKCIEQCVDKRYKKKMLSYSKFRKLTNLIKNNCPTNKNVMIMYTVIINI